jgi:hypothetical protein
MRPPIQVDDFIYAFLELPLINGRKSYLLLETGLSNFLD